ncbi:hypothetical protein Tco_0916099 [Tanacetum coccineum]
MEHLNNANFTDQELRDHPFHSGVTEGKSYHSSLFSGFSPSLEKAEIKWDVSSLIYLLDSKWEHELFSQKLAMVRRRGEQGTRSSAVQRKFQDGPAAPGKRIEEASDSFMHAPLGSGGYSSVGRAPLLQLDGQLVRSSMDRTWTVVGVGGSPRFPIGIPGKRIKLALAENSLMHNRPSTL